MEIIYRADDGKEFSFQEECEAYERRKEILENPLNSRFYDRKGKRMSLEDFVESPDECYFMSIINEEEARRIEEICKDWGCYSPYDINDEYVTGDFFYDCHEEQWRDIEDLYAAYQEVLSVFEGE